MFERTAIVATVLAAAITLGLSGCAGAAGTGSQAGDTEQPAFTGRADSQETMELDPELADIEVVKPDGMPNFEGLFQADDASEMWLMLSHLPRATGFGYFCSSEGAAAMFSFGAGASGLEEGEWGVALKEEGIDMYAVGPRGDEEEAARLIASYTGATKVGILEGEYRAKFEAGDSYHGEAIYDATGSFISMSLYKTITESDKNYYEDWCAENAGQVKEFEF